MKEQRTPIRNVGLFGDGGSGKTSLAEALLYSAGAIERLGKVLDGATTMDYDPDEVKRSKSLTLGLATFQWKKTKINLIDAPGYGNFISDAYASLRVLDAAIFVIHAADGVRVQTQRLWANCAEQNIARLVFVNAMDTERANFEQVLNDLETTLGGASIIPLQLPIGEAATFSGAVDVLSQKGMTFTDGERGEVKQYEVPVELNDALAEVREKLTEGAAEANDDLLEKYLEGGGLEESEIADGLERGILAGKIVPVICGVATRCMGIQPLLEMICEYLPAPDERSAVQGTKPDAEEEIFRDVNENAPFSALVFKTTADPYSGKLSMFRVFSGALSSDSTVLNTTTGEKERIGQLNSLLGKQQQPMEKAVAGDIAVVAKLKTTTTGHTLCDEKEPVVYPTITFANPVISVAIVPKSKGDEEKVSISLRRLCEEDMTLQVSHDPQTKQLIMSGMGEDHLDVVVERLKRKFGVEVLVEDPKVPYRETIRRNTKVQGRYKKQTGGRGQFGDTWLEIGPLERSGGFEFVNKIVGGAIPRQYIPSVEKGVADAMSRGPLAGYPVVDVKVTLFDGSFHSVDSSDMAFQIAGSMGFKKGVEECGLVLLEPIMNMEVSVPEETMGDVIGDLNAKRGKVLGVDAQGALQVIRAQVPLAEVLKYASTLKSLTGDRGAFTMEFSQYEMVPPHLAEKVIAESKQGVG